MRFFLDHVILAVRDLPEAVRDRESIGLVPTDGGTHPKVGTRNALVRFPDGSFLELIAIDDREQLAEYAPTLLALIERYADGPFSWALRTDDIEGAARALADAGFQVQPIWPGEALRNSGKVARWRTLHIQEPGFPFLVQYEAGPTAEPSPEGLPAVGITGVRLAGPQALLTRLAAAFGGRAEDQHIFFGGWAAFLEPQSWTEPRVIGVDLLASDMEGAKRLLREANSPHGGNELDHRSHGLRIRLA